MMQIPGPDLDQLRRMGFDPDGFERIWAQHASGRWERELVIEAGRLAPPPDDALTPLPSPGSAERDRLESAGREAIDRGEVGCIVLNGGMATRFGGVVKGTVEVIGGRSFLDLKLSQIRAVSDRVPIFLMNSPATHVATLAHLESLPRTLGMVFTFLQPVAPRITPEGELARDRDGRVETSGMGHGDVLTSFQSNGLERFLSMDGRTLMVSNVDNLGACLDPALVALHREAGRPVSVEVAPRRPQDKGGMPVMMDGRVQLLEGLRWPPELDGEGYQTFNTNTFLIEAEVFRDPPELEAYPVRKQAHGRTVVQFERILGEVTHFRDTTFIVVPAEGDETRFIPIKRREDVADRSQTIAACLRRWGVL
jgi:UTP--glucose-1-phosphate uridylyltransferase